MLDTTSYDAQVAKRVGSIMDEKKISTLALSEKSGIPRSTLQSRLTGQASFSVRQLRAVAEVLGVKPSSLWPAEDAA